PASGTETVDSTVWSQYTPAFSSTTFTRSETMGPLCNLTVNVGGLAVTHASLRGLRVDPSGVVEFATDRQRSTLWFDIYDTDSLDARAPRVRLSRAPVPAALSSGGAVALYRVETAPVST